MAITSVYTDPKQVEKLEKAAYILKTIAHPIRLAVVHMLEEHAELSVGEICDKLDTEQSLTSHHLQNMKLKGILSSRKSGRKVMYTLKERDVYKIIECIENCDCNM